MSELHQRNICLCLLLFGEGGGEGGNHINVMYTSISVLGAIAAAIAL